MNIWENVRLMAHYFRVKPRLSFHAFIVSPLKRITICAVRGHLAGDFAYRLLGLCDRCYKTMD
jgi:hypothetical protein